MDTDNKKTDDNNITGGEKDTLHNAGVDLSSSDEKTEEFIDIDQAPKVGEDADLKKIGLEFAPIENKEDLSLLKEQMDKNALAQNNASVPEQKPASVFKESIEKPKELEIEPIQAVKKEPEAATFEQKIPKPKPETKSVESDISDLEKEFNQTVGGSTAPAKSESLNEKISSLEAMLEKIKEKLGFKKKEVKAELDNLKKVKEDIAKDIENIKELEESEDKIEAELQKIEKIKEEVSSIEKEVKEELNS